MISMRSVVPARWLPAAVVALAVLAGCARQPVRTDPQDVRAAVAERALGAPALPDDDAPWLDEAFLAEPLTLERAVQASLQNDPLVRAELARLDAAHAARIQAGLLQNPMLSVMGMRPEGGGRWRLEAGLMQSLVDLVRRPDREAVADAAQARVQAEVVLALLDRIRGTEAAWVAAVQATAEEALQRELLALAEKRAGLATRLARSGTASSSALLAEDAALSRQRTMLREAATAVALRRTELAATLGLSSAEALRLPDTLAAPDLSGLPEAPMQRLAAAHPRLQAASAALAEADAEAGLAGTWPGIGEASVGLGAMRESSGMAMAGPALDIALPVFDDGSARRAQAEAMQRGAAHRLESERRALPLAVERALAQLALTRASLEQQQEAVARRERVDALAQRRYAQGLDDWTATADSGRMRLEAEIDALRLRGQVWQALVDLERATAMAMLPATPAAP